MKSKIIIIGILGLIGIIGVGVLLGWVTIQEGYVGVQTEKGAATGEVYEPGWHVQNPVTQNYDVIETRPQTVDFQDEESITVITHDGQDVFVDVTVRYRVDDPVMFYREYHTPHQAEQRLIHPTVRSDLRDEASDTSARDIITREGRMDLEAAAGEALQENFQGSGLTLEVVQVRNVELNAEFSEQLEQVEIEETRAEQRLIEAEAIAEAEIAEAEGQAEAYEIRSEALNEDVLTEEYIKAIERGDTVILATDDNGTPIIINDD